MAVKLKKERFDKYNTEGFKIGDKVYIPKANIHAKIIAIDLDRTEYNIMIDAMEINLPKEDFIEILMIDRLRTKTVYYRKRALKDKYIIWIRSGDVQHIDEAKAKRK